jgi:hypothetical protein
MIPHAGGIVAILRDEAPERLLRMQKQSNAQLEGASSVEKTADTKQCRKIASRTMRLPLPASSDDDMIRCSSIRPTHSRL